MQLSDLIYLIEGEVTDTGDVRQSCAQVTILSPTGTPLTIAGVGADADGVIVISTSI